MQRAVHFDRFGGPEVLEIAEVDARIPQEGEVSVSVKASSLNPIDYKIFGSEQLAKDMFGLVLPSGNGTDFAGIVTAVGDGVPDVRVGDRVFGGKRFYAQADEVIVTANEYHLTPDGLSDIDASTLWIAGRTAAASVDSVSLTASDTVLVSAAAGGVGSFAAQLALRSGARVIGTASSSNHEYLRSLGVTPVAYGEGLFDRVSDLAPEGITSVLDNNGRATLQLALDFGVPPSRVNTIADRGFAEQHGFGVIGGASSTPEQTTELAELLASGKISVNIHQVYPLEDVREAYEELIDGHVRGKIVLVP